MSMIKKISVLSPTARLLQVYATAMAQTADVMKTELEKLRSDLYAAFQTAEHRGPGSSNPLGGAQSADTAAVKELGVEIERLVQHLENMDKQMAEVRHLRSCLVNE